MRVLYVITSMAQGGVERIVADLLTQLQPHVDQHLAIIYPESLYPFFYRSELENQAYTFLNKPLGKMGLLLATWRYRKLVRRFKPDVVVGLHELSMDFVRIFHRFVPVPVVIVGRHSRLEGNFVFSRERKLLPYADSLVVVAKIIADEYAAHVAGSRDKITIIENAADFDTFIPGDRNATRSALGLPQTTTIGLLAGRVTYAKNHMALVQALNLLVKQGRWQPDYHLLCVGRIEDQALYEQLQAYIQRENLSAYIQFQDASDNIVQHYQACDFLVMPSHFEGFGLVIIEAAGCQRPTLITDSANTSEIVQPGSTGWVVPGNDIAALAEGLATAFSLPREARDQMGEAAREFVLPRYNVQRMAEEYLHLYERLLNEKKR